MANEAVALQEGEKRRREEAKKSREDRRQRRLEEQAQPEAATTATAATAAEILSPGASYPATADASGNGLSVAVGAGLRVAREVFESVDLNGNGVLDETEVEGCVRSLFAQLGKPLPSHFRRDMAAEAPSTQNPIPTLHP